MPYNLIIGFILIFLFFLASCAENNPSSNSFTRSKAAPHIQINAQGEPTIELLPITSLYSKNSFIRKLEEEIQRNRAEKTKVKLNELNHEKITFSNPRVLFKNNGQKKVTLDITYNGILESITFLTPKNHEKHFLFTKSSGFSKKIVTLQGMCLDDNKVTCNELALEIAYFVNDLKITEQFRADNSNETKNSILAPEETLIFSKEPSTPKPLPSPTITNPEINSENTIIIDSESTAVGAGRFIFPNIGENTAQKGFNINSAETYDLLQYKKDFGNVLLKEIQTTTFNQSKYFYSKHHDKYGKIIHSTQLPSRLKGSKINPQRRNKQYASGLLIKTVEYISEEFNRLHPKAPICINDLSLKNGSYFKTHRSHQNGLDIDISLPSTANDCRTEHYFKNWKTLDKLDNTFRQKNWEFLNILIATERVNIIFIDKAFVKALCTHVKNKTNATKTQRNKIFKKLRHENKHKNHYHIRMVCNFQNIGCITQPLNGNITDCN